MEDGEGPLLESLWHVVSACDKSGTVDSKSCSDTGWPRKPAVRSERLLSKGCRGSATMPAPAAVAADATTRRVSRRRIRPGRRMASADAQLLLLLLLLLLLAVSMA